MAKVEINHLARIEGHGNLKAGIKNGQPYAKLEVFEAARFFEGILKGRDCLEAPLITARICGICASSHNLASIKAVEAALGVTPSQQTTLLRKLLLCGETLQSHVLHLYFLSLPDFLGEESVLGLVRKHSSDVQRAIKLKKIGNDVCQVIGGRVTHPVSTQVGGFVKVPTERELSDLSEQLAGARIGAEATVELFTSIKMPYFEKERTYLALGSRREFVLYDGDISSNDGLKCPVSKYQQEIKERVVSHSTAKHSTASSKPCTKKVQGKPFMVGALARLNLNAALLSERAKKAMKALKLEIPTHNPFANNLAQVVEVVHFVDEAISLINQLLDKGLKEERIDIQIGAGEGVGAVEAPRGTLYHYYNIDKKGKVRKADVITPTAQNLLMIEEDAKALLGQMAEEPRDKIILALEELVRAYDPCISCSTHLIELEQH